MTDKTNQRIAYLDWMRGFACLLMFQTHCYDSWLGGAARQGLFIRYSQMGGTLPAPLFLFLAGISCALVTDHLRQKGVPPNRIARTTILRGGEVFGYGLLFRIQEFVLGQPWSPWTDLLRVDILNMIGLSLILLGITCRLASAFAPSREAASQQARLRAGSALLGAAGAFAIAMLTPPLWTVYRPRWLPWFLESYINGVHIFDKPQAWLFPLFPWAAFAFAGLAVGFLILSPLARRHELASVTAIAAAGALLFALAWWFDALPRSFYSVYDFWHSSPNFFLMRLGVLMGIVLLSYLWCRWGPGQWRFHPLIELGRSSLLVYWVHIEFVYGRFSILKKGGHGIPGASLGLAVIFGAMTALAYYHNRWKKGDLRRILRLA